MPDALDSPDRARTPAIRVLNDSALDGPTNMARDEALLVRVGKLESPPTLRLYQWEPPTISLGYFQPYAEYESLPPPAGRLAVVRRTTGGGAILHDMELTYSLTLPTNHPLLAGGASRLYELAHDAIIAVLASLGTHAARGGQTDDSGAARGPFFCFDRRHCYDVLIEKRGRIPIDVGTDPSPKRERGVFAIQPTRSGRAGTPHSDSDRAHIHGNAHQEKIVGSAQRRTREAILQHGSIILANRYDQQSTAVLSQPFEDAVQRTRSLLVDCLIEHAETVSFVPGDWSQEELSHSNTLIPKYAGAEWTQRT